MQPIKKLVKHLQQRLKTTVLLIALISISTQSVGQVCLDWLDQQSVEVYDLSHESFDQTLIIHLEYSEYTIHLDLPTALAIAAQLTPYSQPSYWIHPSQEDLDQFLDQFRGTLPEKKVIRKSKNTRLVSHLVYEAVKRNAIIILDAQGQRVEKMYTVPYLRHSTVGFRLESAKSASLPAIHWHAVMVNDLESF